MAGSIRVVARASIATLGVGMMALSGCACLHGSCPQRSVGSDPAVECLLQQRQNAQQGVHADANRIPEEPRMFRIASDQGRATAEPKRDRDDTSFATGSFEPTTRSASATRSGGTSAGRSTSYRRSEPSRRSSRSSARRSSSSRASSASHSRSGRGSASHARPDRRRGR